MVPRLFLFLNFLKPGRGFQYLMDITISVQCLGNKVYTIFVFRRQWIIFLPFVASKKQFIQLFFLRGDCRIWADILSRSRTTLSESTLRSSALQWIPLVEVNPQVDLSFTEANALVQSYVLSNFQFRGSRSQCHDPSLEFLGVIYLFSSIRTLRKVILKLTGFKLKD